MYERNPVSDVYRSCMNALGDAEYCAGVVDAVLQAALSRVHRYAPKGRKKPIFYIVLANNIDYATSPWVDQTKGLVAVVLRGPNHSISLVYEKDDDGRFVLSRAAVSNLEYMAMLNGPLNQLSTSEP
jgi:hypothetical protein